MYKLMLGVILLLFFILNTYVGKTEISLGDFLSVIAFALICAGLDTMKNNKR